MERKVLLGLLDQMGAEYMPKISTERAGTKVIRYAAKIGLPEELNDDERAALIELGIKIPDSTGPTIEDVMMVLITAPAEVPGTAQLKPKEIAAALNAKIKDIKQLAKADDDDNVSINGADGDIYLTGSGNKRATAMAKKAKKKLAKTKKTKDESSEPSDAPVEDAPVEDAPVEDVPAAPAVGKTRAKPSWIEIAVDALIDPECESIDAAIKTTTAEFERIYDKDFTGRRCHARLNVSHASKILMKIGKISIIGDVITHIE